MLSYQSSMFPYFAMRSALFDGSSQSLMMPIKASFVLYRTNPVPEPSISIALGNGSPPDFRQYKDDRQNRPVVESHVLGPHVQLKEFTAEPSVTGHTGALEQRFAPIVQNRPVAAVQRLAPHIQFALFTAVPVSVVKKKCQ